MIKQRKTISSRFAGSVGQLCISSKKSSSGLTPMSMGIIISRHLCPPCLKFASESCSLSFPTICPHFLSTTWILGDSQMVWPYLGTLTFKSSIGNFPFFAWTFLEELASSSFSHLEGFTSVLFSKRETLALSSLTVTLDHQFLYVKETYWSSVKVRLGKMPWVMLP